MRTMPVVRGPWSVVRRAGRPTTSNRRPTTSRRGTTLSEVLVSTLVMSIGVVALATLFPISVLRSIQASQLTNAAVLRYNAEAQLRTVPEIINVGTEWQPGQAYSVGDTVVPTATTRSRNPIAAVYACTTAGASGALEPTWTKASNDGSTLMDNTVVWTTVALKNYIVDPLGYLLVDSTDSNAAFRGTGLTGAREHFGNINGNPFLMKYPYVINRFPAYGFYSTTNSALVNEANAATLAVLPDSWELQVEALEVAYTPGNTNILLGNVDAVQLQDSVQYTTPDLVPDRIVIYDDELKRSHTFPVINVTPNASGAVIDWSGGPLPTGFTPAKVRVESLERRYTYFLSVRQRRSYSYVDVVVAFRRRYSVDDEQVYSCVFRKIDRGLDGAPGNVGNDDGDGLGDNVDTSELGWPGSDDQARNFCIVQYHSSRPQPFYKKGSFVCDIHNLRWYKVIDVTEDVLPPFTINNVTPTGYEVDPIGTDQFTNQPNDRFVRLTLGEPIIENSPMEDARQGGNPFQPLQFQNGQSLGSGGSGGTVGGALLMRGIVDVFPLHPRSTWEEQ